MQPAQALTFYSVFPFIGLIMSVALGPIILKQGWHKFYSKIIIALITICFGLVGYQAGGAFLKDALFHAILLDYVPFICMIFALFVTSGGIYVRFEGEATLLNNVALMIVGVVLANLIGTTGASMLLIRPLLNLNHSRHYKRHLVIFFIFIVSNIGGCLTPVGDPPLFIGYLKGVDFFWPTIHLFKPVVLILLPLFLFMILTDLYYRKKEPFKEKKVHHCKKLSLEIHGKRNFLFIILIPLLVIFGSMSAFEYSFELAGIPLKASALIRDFGLIFIGYLSYKLTPYEVHHENHFSFEAFKEVAWVFLGIFLTLIPIIAVLHLQFEGFFAPFLSLVNPEGVPSPWRYFWSAGFLSGFLDNAPTYYVFFHLAGGDAVTLMTSQAPVLTALSCAAVFFGALTYIGNAPNFMVYALSKHKGIPMPSFLGYIGWSFGILVPLFVFLSWWMF